MSQPAAGRDGPSPATGRNEVRNVSRGGRGSTDGAAEGGVAAGDPEPAPVGPDQDGAPGVDPGGEGPGHPPVREGASSADEDEPAEPFPEELEDDDWDDDDPPFRRRPLWVTIPLHLVLMAIIVLDTWAAFAWSGGAGQLGATLAAICASVSLIFLVFLVTDARRHWPRVGNRR